MFQQLHHRLIHSSPPIPRTTFVNPYSHHSYFTVRALSSLGASEVLCPPLILQLLLGHWRRDALSIRWSMTGVLIAQPLSILSYLLHSYRLIPESLYLACFRLAARLLLFGSNSCQIVYGYQDYLLPIVLASKGSFAFICECIIQIPLGQLNRQSSLLAARRARLVLAPTTRIQEEFDCEGIPVILAPYGGDKSCYRTSGRLHAGKPLQPDGRHSQGSGSLELLIAARANTRRKGADILFEALEQLDEHWPPDVQARIQVVICGTLSESALLKDLHRLEHRLASSQRIAIRTGQLTQDCYLDLLMKADLFIMPSRLEGSSPAALEALWMGVPALLSSSCGIEAFQSGEHGLILDPLSSHALQQALLTLLADQKSLEVWRLNLQRDTKKFTWDGYMQTVSTAVAAI